MKELVVFMSKQKIAPKNEIPLPPLGMFIKELMVKALNFAFTQVKKQKMFFNYYPSLLRSSKTIL